MVDSREVENPANEAHATHMGTSHCLRPRVCDKEAVDDEIALRCVKVKPAHSAAGTVEEAILRLAAGTVSLPRQQTQKSR